MEAERGRPGKESKPRPAWARVSSGLCGRRQLRRRQAVRAAERRLRGPQAGNGLSGPLCVIRTTGRATTATRQGPPGLPGETRGITCCHAPSPFLVSVEQDTGPEPPPRAWLGKDIARGEPQPSRDLFLNGMLVDKSFHARRPRQPACRKRGSLIHGPSKRLPETSSLYPQRPPEADLPWS